MQEVILHKRGGGLTALLVTIVLYVAAVFGCVLVNLCGNLFRMVISNRKVGYFMGCVADSRSTFPDSGFNNKNVCEQKRKIEL